MNRHHSEYECITRWIEHSSNNQRMKDKMIFNEYENGFIDLNECYFEFINNNGLNYCTVIELDVFHDWLQDLGYYTGKEIIPNERITYQPTDI